MYYTNERNFDSIRELLKRNGAELEQWEFTSSGFWFTFKFEEISFNYNCDKMLFITVGLQELGYEITNNTFEVLEYDEENDDYTILHDMEVI